MKLSQLLACSAGLVLSTQALKLVQRDAAQPKTLHAEIQRKQVDNPVARDRLRKSKRSSTLQETLDNLETLYFANATLGTPAQSLRLHIDTGSSDLWTNSASSTLCEARGNDCSISGTYDANSSSTYEFVNSKFNISYVDGSGAAGDYVKDTLNFGGTEIPNMQFGIGYTSTSAEGILGIGYAINEVQVNRAGGNTYPNLPQLLVNQGVIQSNAYSLWLNDLDASTGSILFGAVDSDKYSGSLTTLPIISESGVYAEFIIGMTGVGANGDAGSILNGTTVPVLLDSGSSLMYLPDDVVVDIYNKYGASYSSSQGAAFVSCDLATSSDTIDFTFSNVTISVALNEVVLVAGYSKGKAVCILGIGPAGDSTAVLGDTFLRSAYVVYDLAQNEISLAQTNFNATTSNILEITNSTGVPDAVGVANTVSSGSSGASATSKGAAVPRMTSMPAWGKLAAAGLGLAALL